MSEIIVLDEHGNRVEDPTSVLGLQPGATPEAVRNAWVSAVQALPSPQDPDALQRLTSARDALTRPSGVYARYLGHITAPSAVASQTVSPERHVGLSGETRLLAATVLYALVEADLWDQGLLQRYIDTASELRRAADSNPA